jgi:hypothetical protein
MTQVSDVAPGPLVLKGNFQLKLTKSKTTLTFLLVTFVYRSYILVKLPLKVESLIYKFIQNTNCVDIMFVTRQSVRVSYVVAWIVPTYVDR